MWPIGFADANPTPPPPIEPPLDSGEDTAPPPAAQVESASDAVNDTLSTLLPWGVSILAHAALVLLAVFIVWTTIVTTEDEDIIIPVLELSPTPNEQVQVSQPLERVQQQTQQRTPTPRATPSPQNLVQQIDVSTVGLTGLTAPPAPLNAAANTPQLSASFVGSRGGNARKIVFLIDASGSLVDTLPFVLNELKNSIRKLSEQQSFTVIFFGNFEGKEFREVPPGGLQRANAANKQKVMQWIDLDNRNIYVFGSGDPTPALQQALAYKPDLVFLLSDDITGTKQYAVDRRRLIDSIKTVREKMGANTKINTIQFLYKDPAEQWGERGTLELIALETGGRYTFVSEQELTR